MNSNDTQSEELEFSVIALAFFEAAILIGLLVALAA